MLVACNRPQFRPRGTLTRGLYDELRGMSAMSLDDSDVLGFPTTLLLRGELPSE
jgi:hypothetical protein